MSGLEGQVKLVTGLGSPFTNDPCDRRISAKLADHRFCNAGAVWVFHISGANLLCDPGDRHFIGGGLATEDRPFTDISFVSMPSRSRNPVVTVSSAVVTVVSMFDWSRLAQSCRDSHHLPIRLDNRQHRQHRRQSRSPPSWQPDSRRWSHCRVLCQQCAGPHE